jgi:hypothetical protein
MCQASYFLRPRVAVMLCVPLSPGLWLRIVSTLCQFAVTRSRVICTVT